MLALAKATCVPNLGKHLGGFQRPDCLDFPKPFQIKPIRRAKLVPIQQPRVHHESPESHVINPEGRGKPFEPSLQ